MVRQLSLFWKTTLTLALCDTANSVVMESAKKHPEELEEPEEPEKEIRNLPLRSAKPKHAVTPPAEVARKETVGRLSLFMAGRKSCES